MKFCEQLGNYIEQLSCTAKELCELSGISPSTFSRYRSGERIPEIDTVAFDGLCNALEAVAILRITYIPYFTSVCKKILNRCHCSKF